MGYSRTNDCGGRGAATATMLGENIKTVVVVGCGFAGSAAARELSLRGGGSLRVVAYDKQACLYNYPALPRLLNEDLPRDRIEIPLTRILAGASIDLRQQRVQAVDTRRRFVQTDTDEVAYDYLVLAPGSRAKPISQDQGVSVFYPKALRHLRQLAAHIGDIAERQARPATASPHRIAVIGGGLTGVEFSMAIRQAADRASEANGIDRSRLSVSLYEAAARLHPRGPARLSLALARELTAYGIQVLAERKVEHVSHGTLLTSQGEEAVDTIICCIGSRPNLRIGLNGIATERQGIPVDRMLRCTGHEAEYIVGDGMLLHERGLPRLDLRLAHRAVTQGRHVARNIVRQVRGGSPGPYRPRNSPIGVMLQSDRGVFSYGGLLIGGRFAGKAKRWLELRHT